MLYITTCFSFDFNPTFMKLTCPECKNDVDLSNYPGLAAEQVLECDVCGITLMVSKIDEDKALAEVVDEGKWCIWR